MAVGNALRFFDKNQSGARATAYTQRHIGLPPAAEARGKLIEKRDRHITFGSNVGAMQTFLLISTGNMRHSQNGTPDYGHEHREELINVKIAPANVAGEEGTRRLMQLFRVWCA